MEKDKEELLIRQIHGDKNKDESIEDSSLKTDEPQEEAGSTTETVDEPKATEPQTEQTEESAEQTEPTETTESKQVSDWTELASKEGWISPDAKDKYYNLEEDPYIAKLIEFKQKGIDIQDANFLLEQNVDYSSFDVENPRHAIELITKELTVNNPDADQEDIHYLVEKEFGALYEKEPIQREDELDEEYDDRLKDYRQRKRDAEVTSKFRAREARKMLQERQSQMAMPKVEQQPQLTPQEIEARKKEITKQADAALKEFSQIKVNVADQDVSLDVSDKVKEIKKTMLNEVVFENTFFSNYVKDGNISYQQLAEDLMWANKETRDTLIQAAVNQALSVGEEKTVKALKNTELPTKPSAPQIGKQQLEGADLLAYQIAQRRRANS